MIDGGVFLRYTSGIFFFTGEGGVAHGEELEGSDPERGNGACAMLLRRRGRRP